MAEADERTSTPVNDIVVAAERAEKSAVAKGTDDEYPLQKVEEIEYHPDCSVCLQPCYYPVKLPCAHIFCFLCIKGVALRSRRCALCRQTITADFFEKPTLVKVVGATKEAIPKGNAIDTQTANETAEEVDSREYVWFYEGRSGWWQYDEKTSIEVEKAFKTGKRSCTLLIAGFLYVVDFENMFQTRKNEPGRRRRIKRDKPDTESKGIAGIRAACKRPANAETGSTEALSSSKNEDGKHQDRAGDATATRGENKREGSFNDPLTQQSGQTERENSSANVEKLVSRSSSDNSAAEEGK